jgi:two-component sensor histidine kinase
MHLPKNLGLIRPQASKLWSKSSLIAVLSLSLIFLELLHTDRQRTETLGQIDSHLLAIANLTSSILVTNLDNLASKDPTPTSELDLRLWRVRRAEILSDFNLSTISIFVRDDGEPVLIDGVYAEGHDDQRQKMVASAAKNAFLTAKQNSGLHLAQTDGSRLTALYATHPDQRDFVIVLGMDAARLHQVVGKEVRESEIFALFVLVTALLIWALVYRVIDEAKLRLNNNTIVDRKLEAAFSGMEVVTNAGGWWLDLKDNRLRWSPQTFAIHEVDQNTPMDVNTAIEFYAPHERVRIRSLVERCITSGTSYDEEFDFITARGQKLRVRSTGGAVREGDEISYIYGTFQDVTKFTHQAGIVELYHKLLANSDALVCVLDKDFKVLSLNQHFVNLVGMTVSSCLDLHLSEESKDAFKAALQSSLINGKTWSGKLSFNGRTNQNLIMMALCIPHMDSVGKLAQVLVQCQNITDITRLLHHKQALIRALPSYLLILDRDFRVNEVFNAHLLNRSADEIIGRTIFEVTPGQYLEDVRKAVQLAWDGKIGYVHYEFKIASEPHHHRAVYSKLEPDQIVIYAEDTTREQLLIREKDTLLRELAHRVKNNFQLISSLLGISLTKAQHPAVVQTINEVRSRVYVMGLIHQAMLGVQEFSSIDLRQYLFKIDEYVSFQFGLDRSRIGHVFAEESSRCGPETALYLGMLLNELLTNSAKHASNRPATNVTYGIVANGAKNSFFYRDDGGFFDMPHDGVEEQIGSELIRVFSSALGGTLYFSSMAELQLDQNTEWQANGKPLGALRLDFIVK